MNTRNCVIDDLTYRQLSLLITLAVMPGSPDFKGPGQISTTRVLSRLTDMTPAAVYRQIRSLALRGYVEVIRGNMEKIVLKRLPDGLFVKRRDGYIVNGLNVRGCRPPYEPLAGRTHG